MEKSKRRKTPSSLKNFIRTFWFFLYFLPLLQWTQFLHIPRDSGNFFRRKYCTILPIYCISIFVFFPLHAYNELKRENKSILPQRLKPTFFEILSSLRVSFIQGCSTRKISKNVEFSLSGKQCIVLPKWTMLCVCLLKRVLGVCSEKLC